MKTFILILYLLFYSLSYSQNYDAMKINLSDSINIDKLKRSEIYSIEKSELIKLISNSSKKFNLIVSFGTWCSPCRKSLPLLIKLIEENKEKINLYLINIEKDKSKSLFETKQYLYNLGYLSPTFMVSEKYGKGMRSKYKNFIKDLIGEEKFSDLFLGMFENILYDKNLNILYKSTYNDIDEITLQNIKKMINE